MKTKSLLLPLFAAAVLSCSKEGAVTAPVTHESEQVSQETAAAVFQSSFGDVVKSTLNGNKVHWESTDEISILWEGGSATARAAVEGLSTTFTAEVGSASTYYAVYPSSLGATLAGTTISLSIPITQHGTFAEANIAVSSTSSAAKSFAFKNLCALGKFTLSRSDIAEVHVSANKGMLLGNASFGDVIAGDVTITLDGENVPTSVAVSAAPEGTEIVLTPASGDAFAAGDYYFCTLPGDYEGGICFVPVTTSGTSLTKKVSFRTVELDRSAVLNFGTVDTSSDLLLSFDFAIGETARAGSEFADWPLARASKPFDTGYNFAPIAVYPLNGTDYTFELITPGSDDSNPNKTRFSWGSAGARFVVFQYGLCGLPAIYGYKLSQIAINHGKTTQATVGVCKAISDHSAPATQPSESDYVTGGSSQKYSTSVDLYYYYLDGTEGNTRYYLCIPTKEVGIDRLHLIYKQI